MSEVSGFTHAEMISQGREAISREEQSILAGYLKRRLSGEPVNRILGREEFYGREFLLSADTLVPRADTEVLIDAVLEYCTAKNAPLRILDFGTGSGIIAITLAAELEDAQIMATDVSADAINTAKKNARRLLNYNIVEFQAEEGLETLAGRFDIIVSNPPYIASDEVPRLQREVRDHDPIAALDGGADGLDYYRHIFQNSTHLLEADGAIVLEIGYDQEAKVRRIALRHGYSETFCRSDLTGITRVLGFGQKCKKDTYEKAK